MSSVFIGGSRKLTRLNKLIRERLDKVLANNFTILVGDANGTDRAVQSYLAQKGYANVRVYCVNGHCRNNLGAWHHIPVSASSTRRDFRYFVAKDVAMAQDASYGFMIWDGKSKGTLNNVLNLLSQKKKVLFYVSPRKKFWTVSDFTDLQTLLPSSAIPLLRTLLNHSHMEMLVAPASTE